MLPSQPPDRNPITQGTYHLPVEIELTIEPDGAVVFADLAADAVPIARRLMGKEGTMFKLLIQALRDGLAILPLSWQVAYLKLRAFDRLLDDLSASRENAHALGRTVRRLTRQVGEREAQIATLETQKPLASASVREAQLAAFKHLRPIATQLPSLRASIRGGKNVSAEEILELLAPLYDALSEMGFEPLGAPGETVAFDPTHHRAVGKGARDIKPGDAVNVQAIGYTHGGETVYKAQVTRTSK